MLKFLQALAKMEKPAANLLEGIREKVKAAAADSKLQVADWQGGYKIGNDEHALVAVQFGGRREFYETMERMEKEDAAYRAIITSSNVKSMKIGEIKWILNNKYQTKNKWLIIDIEHAESPKTVNFMLYGGSAEGRHDKEYGHSREHMKHEEGHPERETGGREQREVPKRKRIYGVRGQHKEQD